MAKKKNELTDKQKKFLTAYSDDFNIAKACRKAGISRPTYYRWLRDIKDFNEAVENISEAYIDLSEAVIRETLLNGYKTDKSGELIQITHPVTGESVAQRSKEAIDAAKFVLTRKGRDRGYVEKIDINADIQATKDKLAAKEVIIDITPEELEQKLLERLKK